MTTREDPWPDGTPAWADLMVPDRESAFAFYRRVLGWDIVSGPRDMGIYAFGMVEGRPAAGIGEPPPGVTDAPVVWTTYLATDDVDKTCDVIGAHGGTVVLEPMSVGREGRIAIAVDPTGAVFGMWQAVNHIGAQITDEPGAMVWNECMSRDAATAREFYAAAFGYRYVPIQGAGDYTMIGGRNTDNPDAAIGGIGQIGDDRSPATPSHWMTYFAVSSADASVERVRDAGGRVRRGPLDTPYGRIAVLEDPQGAVFSVLQISRWV